MNLNEFSKEVHANAVNHGWWDEERKLPEILALIHSEWSEALEEARAGRPMAYTIIKHNEFTPSIDEIIERGSDGTYTSNMGLSSGTSVTGGKPEGIAVELIDGCIRILDYISYLDASIKVQTLQELMEAAPCATYEVELPRLVANLHLKISQAYMTLRNVSDEGLERRGIAMLYEAISVACCWMQKQGIDPEKLMLEKHEYNKTRPYKHGKKF